MADKDDPSNEPLTAAGVSFASTVACEFLLRNLLRTLASSGNLNGPAFLETIEILSKGMEEDKKPFGIKIAEELRYMTELLRKEK